MSTAQTKQSEDEGQILGGRDAVVGAILFVVTLLVYLLTLSAGAYPGESASRIVQVLGLFPNVLPSHPLWSGIARGVAWLPGGTVTMRLNLFSALCGAGAIWLLYDLMRTTIQRIVEPYSLNWVRVPLISRVAGILAALFLAFSVPFWMVSTRAHPAAFDLLLLLAVLRLLVYWLPRRQTATGCLLLFASALLCAEFATALLLLPVLCVAMPVLLWRKEELRGGRLVAMGASVLAGLSFYLVMTWVFVGSEGYVLRGYTGFGHVLRQVARQQYLLLLHSLPREGWLIILFITVVPWVTALAVGRRGLNVERDWSYYLLHVIMTVLVLLVLLNVRIAPWPMLKEQAELGQGRLLVTPYLLSASLFGYLAAYWFLLPRAWWERGEHRFVLWLQSWLGTLLVLPAGVLVLVMPFFNAPAANGRQAKFVQMYAEATLDAMSGRKWLVSDGSVDSHLLIAAYDRKQPLELISLPSSRNELYMRFIASKFDRPRIKNLARVGAVPMLHEWMANAPGIEEELAVQSMADLWVGEGYTPRPNHVVFVGVPEGTPVEAGAALATHEAFWSERVAMIEGVRVYSGGLERLRQHMLRHIARLANNLGVLLEDEGRREQAFEVYARARAIDPDNVSALLNQLALVDAGIRPQAGEEIRRDVKALLEGLEAENQKYRLWSLSRYYGYVRLPQAFASLGWTWAFSGQPSLAVAGLQKAMDLMPEEGRTEMKQTLAGLHVSTRNPEAGEAIYRELLEEDPENVDALLGMSRVEVARGRPKAALEYLRQAREAGAPRQRLALELAGVLALSGSTERARVLVDELVELAPNDQRVWSLLLAILIQDQNREGLAESITRMREAGADRSVVFSLAKGHLALMENAFSEARGHFDRVLAMNPNHLHALRMILRLDVQQGRESDAAAHAKRLLALDPADALANRIKGSLQVKEGNLMLAEDSFRRALESERSPDALNDLAWVLQEQAAFEEAEALAREAVERGENDPGHLDTLGVILTKTDRLTEARETLEAALRVSRGNPVVHLHLAQVYARQNEPKRLGAVLDDLGENERYLTAEQRKIVEQLRQTLQGNRDDANGGQNE